jgi:hypothetical protein
VLPSGASPNFFVYIIEEASGTYMFYFVFWNFYQLFRAAHTLLTSRQAIPGMDFTTFIIAKLQLFIAVQSVPKVWSLQLTIVSF